MDSYAGILHLGGPQKISRFDFGVKAAEIFGLDVALLNACSQDTINFPAPRPKDVSLNSAKAFSLGYQPLTLEEELKLIFEGTYF
jgi:dTDP-4-dehydrorhamnose reductase